MNNVDRKIILALPVGIRSWIILNDYTREYGDMEVFKKIIVEYGLECPIKEMLRIFKRAGEWFADGEISELFALYMEVSCNGKQE